MTKRKKNIFLGVGMLSLSLLFICTPIFFNNRPLTEQEFSILSPMYKSSIDLKKIKINMGGPLTFIYPGVTIGNVISFPRGRYDPSNEKDQALLVHEVCHIWQYQHFGLGYIPRSLWETVTQRDTYVVHYNEEKSLRDYDVEEQCEIIAEIYSKNTSEYLLYLDDLQVEQ